MQSKHCRQLGFTLVEVQIALLILLLIMAVVMGSLHLMTKTQRSITDLQVIQQDIRVITRFLNRQMQMMLPVRALESGEVSVLFKGQADQIGYVGHLPEQLGKGGPWLIQLYVEEAQLILTYRAMDITGSVDDNWIGDTERVVLLPDVSQMSMRYFDHSNQRWVSRWDDTERLPAAASIELIQAGKTWPKVTTFIPVHSGMESRFNLLEFNENAR